MNESNDIAYINIATYYNSIRIMQQIYFFIFLILNEIADFLPVRRRTRNN